MRPGSRFRFWTGGGRWPRAGKIEAPPGQLRGSLSKRGQRRENSQPVTRRGRDAKRREPIIGEPQQSRRLQRQ